MVAGLSYLSPAVTSVSPAQGAGPGGLKLTIRGREFGRVAPEQLAIMLGALRCGTPEWISGGEVRCVTPSAAAVLGAASSVTMTVVVTLNGAARSNTTAAPDGRNSFRFESCVAGEVGSADGGQCEPCPAGTFSAARNAFGPSTCKASVACRSSHWHPLSVCISCLSQFRETVPSPTTRLHRAALRRTAAQETSAALAPRRGPRAPWGTTLPAARQHAPSAGSGSSTEERALKHASRAPRAPTALPARRRQSHVSPVTFRRKQTSCAPSARPGDT